MYASVMDVHAANVSLAWDYDASGAAGFALYCGISGNTYSRRIDVGNTTTFAITGLADATKYFCVAVAYDTEKVESPYSNELSFTTATSIGSPTPVPAPAPDPSTPSPVAAFTESPTSGTAPLTVAFSNATTGMVTSWSWEFGDGATSTLQNPTHVFQTPATYTVALTAVGPGGTSVLASSVVVTSSSSGPGLVAAYSFDEGAGNTVADLSGHGNVGVISDVTWSKAGHFGNALQFAGNGWVTVSDSPSLNLNTMTLEAWVYPTATMDGWIDVMMKETAVGGSYYLCANSQWGVPVGGVTITQEQMVLGLAALPREQWSHLATTYDGSYQRMYLNGVLVASRAQQGVVAPSTGPLRFGGDSVWGERFTGVIDEVRIYNRALSISEIQSDMKTAISTP